MLTATSIIDLRNHLLNFDQIAKRSTLFVCCVALAKSGYAKTTNSPQRRQRKAYFNRCRVVDSKLHSLIRGLADIAAASHASQQPADRSRLHRA